MSSTDLNTEMKTVELATVTISDGEGQPTPVAPPSTDVDNIPPQYASEENVPPPSARTSALKPIPLPNQTYTPTNSHSVVKVAAEVPDLQRQKSLQAQSSYMDYLHELKAAWKDRPDITVTYSDMQYKIPMPKNRREVPTMATSFYDTALKLVNPQTYTRSTANCVDFYALRPASGVIRPGTMTLVLAPPGHGSTVYLKAIGGKYRYNKYFSGNLEYNGASAQDMDGIGARLSKLTSYADQVDAHLPHLTLYETFNVAYQHSSGNLDGLENVTPRLKELDAQRVELMVDLLGLRECRNTVIGNAMVRGVSGGQKRRATIGEALLSNARILLLDEITTGLDSSSALDIFKYLRSWTDLMNGSVVTTLLQPTPEVVALFDDIVLLRESEVVYHGPVNELLPYFESLGLPTPNDQDFADYINDFLSYPRAVFYRNLYRKVKQEKHNRGLLGTENATKVDAELNAAEQKVPLSRDGLAKRFKASKFHADITANLATLRAQSSKEAFQQTVSKWGPYTHQIFSREFPHSLVKHTAINFKRQTVLSLRNKEDLIPRFAQAVIFALVLGSVYHGLSFDQYYLKAGVMFFTLGFFQFSSSVELPFTHEQKFVVYKQTDAGLYPEAAHVSAHACIVAIVSAICALLYSVIIYFLVGFVEDGARWLFFTFVVYSAQLFTIGSFRLLAYSTTLDTSMLLTSPVLFFGVLYGGFLILRDQIDWMIFLYYLSPFSWGVRSMAQNEMFAGKYQVPITPNSTETAGDYFLTALGLQTDPIWKWMGILYLLAGFVFFTVISVYFLRYIRQAINVGTRRSDEDQDAEEHDAAEIRRQMSRQLSKQAVDVAASGAIIASHASVPALMAGSTQISTSSVLPFLPANLAWKNLEYTVKVKDDQGKTADRKLLSGVSGFARAGTMTALMGSSGAGKTTLLDVIAGRKTAGKLQGDIFVNGYPKVTATFNRSCGYVEQTDIHVGTATVREALEFSAKLRLPRGVSEDQRRAFVNEVLHLLELNSIADNLIGDETTSHGLSPGQLKRVTIGVELVANPPILFLDEPTSGLDSRAALIVMRVVKRIAATGRSVVCTIHQPSADLFYMFDQMLVLQRGGKTAYFGPLGEFGSDLVEYFEHAPTGDDKGQPKLPEKTNPASWMLDVIGAGTANVNRNRDYATIYEQSPLQGQMNTILKEIMTPLPNSTPISFESVYAKNTWVQFYTLFTRFWLSYWRDLDYNNTRVIVMAVVSIVMGLLYLKISENTTDGVQSRLGAIYIGIGFVGVTSVMSALPVLSRIRAVFYREKASYFYRPIVFSTAAAAIEIPYTMLTSVTFAIPFYFMVGLETSAAAFFQYCFALCLLTLCFTYWGQFLISALPNLIAANVISGFSAAFIFLFGGVFIQPGAIPAGWKWVYYLDWYPKALNAIASTQFVCDTDNHCPPLDSTGINRQTYVENFLSISFSINEYWNNIGWLFLTMGILHFLTALCIRYLNHLVR